MTRKLKQIGKIGLVANPGKPECAAAVRRAAALIQRTGRRVFLDEASAKPAVPRAEAFPSVAALAKAVDLLLVFGGDGTMLRVAHDIDGSETPIFGVNVGTLGFLTCVNARDLAPALQSIWEGDFVVESRPIIEAAGACAGSPVRMRAFNDIVITHGAVSRLIELEVSVDGEALTRYRGDGLIVCSPSGSTAYSLSAGGPIISPTADVLAITPICAHALSNRSVLVNLHSVVHVKLLSHAASGIVAADGQTAASIQAGDAVTIFCGRRKVRFLSLRSSTFFDAVRRKLGWSGSSV